MLWHLNTARLFSWYTSLLKNNFKKSIRCQHLTLICFTFIIYDQLLFFLLVGVYFKNNLRYAVFNWKRTAITENNKPNFLFVSAGGSSTSTSESCVDIIDNCAALGPNTCQDYVEFSHVNCQRTCNLCKWHS